MNAALKPAPVEVYITGLQSRLDEGQSMSDADARQLLDELRLPDER